MFNKRKENLKIFFAFLIIAILGMIIGYDIKTRQEFRNGYNNLFIDSNHQELRENITVKQIEELEDQWKNLIGTGDIDKLKDLEKIRSELENNFD